MLVSLNWLQEYVDISEFNASELRAKMSSAGLSVERQYMVGEGIEHIVIGEIIEKIKHPDSDHLWITKVRINGEDCEDQSVVAQIVTGAQNIEVGDKVPVVLPGYCLPGGHCVEITILRGVESAGMLCSEKELGLGDDNAGILILDPEAPVGVSLSSVYGFPDIVFDVEITPNRGDLLSMVGMLAR